MQTGCMSDIQDKLKSKWNDLRENLKFGVPISWLNDLKQGDWYTTCVVKISNFMNIYSQSKFIEWRATKFLNTKACYLALRLTLRALIGSTKLLVWLSVAEIFLFWLSKQTRWIHTMRISLTDGHWQRLSTAILTLLMSFVFSELHGLL